MSLSAEQIAELKAAFQQMDANGDGFIDEAERKDFHEKMREHRHEHHKEWRHKTKDDGAIVSETKQFFADLVCRFSLRLNQSISPRPPHLTLIQPSIFSMLPLETLENRNIYERELFFHFKKSPPQRAKVFYD